MLNAPKKTFKKSKKVKKLVVKLKNSKGKAIAKKKITLTVNKKKYTAKTNKKGKAISRLKTWRKKEPLNTKLGLQVTISTKQAKKLVRLELSKFVLFYLAFEH